MKPVLLSKLMAAFIAPEQHLKRLFQVTSRPSIITVYFPQEKVYRNAVISEVGQVQESVVLFNRFSARIVSAAQSAAGNGNGHQRGLLPRPRAFRKFRNVFPFDE